MRTKSFFWVVAGILALGLVAGVQAKGKTKMNKTYKNPILSGFHPDPSLCRVGDDFYLVNSTFEYFPGLPIYHSRDLVHWELIGNALDRPSQLPLKGATDYGGLYAPTIRYWKGLFYLMCCNVSGGGEFFVTAKDPAGPWSEPVWLDNHDIDGSMFFDDDGKVYYTCQGGGERAGIKQAELDIATGKLTTPFKAIWNDKHEQWNEGPHLYKIKGSYYLMLAEGGTGDQHMVAIGRSKSPWGPFDPCPYNPILTERDEPKSPIQCTGHADIFDAPDGSWWAVFLGTRPHNGMSVLGRETFLAPVTWTDGWPVVNGDHHIAPEMPAPQLKPFAVSKPPARILFTAVKLGPEWLHVRNYDPDNFSLSARKGYLRIKAAKDSMDKKMEEPAFVGVRQPAFRLTVRTEMEFTPVQDGEEAGLCVRANDDNHYEISVGRFDGKTLLFVRNHVKGQSYVVAQTPFDGSKVQLEISSAEDRYQFAWSVDGQAWKTLAASPSADLSRERAGGFTGTAIGLYATANGQESKSYADFAWFEVLPDVVPDTVVEFAARPTPTPPPPQDTWRIRAGGDDFTDHTGVVWHRERGIMDGDTAWTGRPIQAKEDPALYTIERWGADFGYTFPVMPGKYKVRMKFAETYVKGPGQRVFDILINDKKVLANFDIFKEAGGMDIAVDKTFENIEPDASGLIRIRFVASVQNAKVCAVEVVRQK